MTFDNLWDDIINIVARTLKDIVQNVDNMFIMRRKLWSHVTPSSN